MSKHTPTRLELCKEHKQESNQSHFDKSNCDYCKQENQIKELMDYIEAEAKLKKSSVALHLWQKYGDK